MFTLGLSMKLRPGAFERYKLAMINCAGTRGGMSANQVSMAIYRDGDRLFLFAAAPSKRIGTGAGGIRFSRAGCGHDGVAGDGRAGRHCVYSATKGIRFR